MNKFMKGAVAALGLGVFAGSASAQFAGGTLAVTQVGDGTGALSSAAWNSYLDDYSVSGTYNGQVGLGVTNSGTATSELQLNIAGNGKSLTAGGYTSTEGTTGVASSTGPRVISNVGLAGTVDTTTSISTFFSGNNIRSVWTPDGSGYYAAGPKGLVYVGEGGATGNQLISTANIRQVQGYNGNIYYTTASSGSIGLWEVSGMPTTGTQTPTQVLSVASTDSPYDFFFANSTTLYVADDGSATGDTQGGIQKYSFANGSWSLDYTGLGTGFTGLRSITTDGTNIYGIAVTSTGADDLVSLTDNGTGFSSFNLLAAPSTDENFRGVRFIPNPAPEPASMAALGLGIAGLIARRRKAGK